LPQKPARRNPQESDIVRIGLFRLVASLWQKWILQLPVFMMIPPQLPVA
jgi:hypothetical protein